MREKLVGDGKPIVSGHIAYRAVLKRDEVPADLWRPDVILWAGPRTHLVHYPLRRGELYNLVAVFHSDRYVEGWNAKADTGELWAHFKGQRPEVLRMPTTGPAFSALASAGWIGIISSLVVPLRALSCETRM